MSDTTITLSSENTLNGELASVFGKDGFSPIAKVEKSGNKSMITVTDKNGTTVAEVLDGDDGISVSSATINSSGHLILTLSNGQTSDAGVAKGANGTDGNDGISVTNAVINTDGHLIITLSNGTNIDSGTASTVDQTFDSASTKSQSGKAIYDYLMGDDYAESFKDSVRSVCQDNPIGENNPFPVPSSEIYQALNNKIDKVDGKVLSTNDYTTDEKTKLSGIEAQANKTVTDQSYNKASANPQSGKAISDYLNSSDCSSHFATLLCSGNPIESNNEFPVTSGVIYTALLNKQNVPNRVTVSGETLTVSDNAEYYGENITALTVTYPTGNFECWLRLQFAETGTITVTLPTSRYIGEAPQFKNGETWEISIKDGVVVAQKLVDDNE